MAKFLNGTCMAYWSAANAKSAYAGVREIFYRLAALRKSCDPVRPQPSIIDGTIKKVKRPNERHKNELAASIGATHTIETKGEVVTTCVD